MGGVGSVSFEPLRSGHGGFTVCLSILPMAVVTFHTPDLFEK